MIKKRDGKWVVLNSAGDKVLGTHPSEEKAKAQLAAIEISKKERGEDLSIKDRMNFLLDESWKNLGDWKSPSYVGSFKKGEAKLYKDGKNWLLDYDDQTVEMPKKASFDHAEGAILDIDKGRKFPPPKAPKKRTSKKVRK